MTGDPNESGPGPSNPLPDGLRRPTGHGPKLRRVEPVHVTEDQKRAIVRGESPLKQVPKRKQLEIVALARLGTLDQTFHSTTEPAAPAQRRQGTIPRDPEQPSLRILDLNKLVAATERLVEAVLQ